MERELEWDKTMKEVQGKSTAIFQTGRKTSISAMEVGSSRCICKIYKMLIPNKSKKKRCNNEEKINALNSVVSV